jgi:predicted enzyme related to lactoylglutathione lyase
MHRLLRTGVVAVLQTALAVVFLGGCASRLPELPVIGTEGNTLPGKVVWHDLVTPDLDKSRAFYGELFGWQFEQLSDGYLLARHEGRPVAGLARLEERQDNGHWLPLVSVTDIAKAQKITRTAGGDVVLGAFELRGRGQVAVLKDPQGAAFGVLQSDHGDPEDRIPPVNTWLWNEIWTNNIAGATAYYEELFDYERKVVRIGSVSYDFFVRDGKPRAGLLAKPDPQIPNTWLCYLRVNDVAAVTDKARALGGSVLMAPNAKVRDGRVAILTDPSGAGFVVQEVRK